jgi:hypothetical protein
MKKIIILLLLFVGVSAIGQQMGFNYVEITAEENAEKAIAELFDSYMEGKDRKSGNIFLERLRQGGENGRTHRIVWIWELDNGGFVEEPGENESKAFWRGLRTLVDSWGEARAGRILNVRFGDEEKNSSIHIWDIKASDEEAFIAAQNTLVEEASSAFEDRLVGFGTYDVNTPNGATHWFLVSGEDINDHLSLYNALRKEHENAFSKYFKNRGEVEYAQDFMVKRIKTY